MEQFLILLWFSGALFLPLLFPFVAVLWKGYVRYRALVVTAIAIALFFIGANIGMLFLIDSKAVLLCVASCIFDIMLTALGFVRLYPNTLEPRLLHKMVVKRWGFLRIDEQCYKRYIIGTVKEHGQACEVCLLEGLSKNSEFPSSSPFFLREYELPLKFTDDEFFQKMGIHMDNKDKEDLALGKFALAVEVIDHSYKIVKMPIVCLI